MQGGGKSVKENLKTWIIWGIGITSLALAHNGYVHTTWIALIAFAYLIHTQSLRWFHCPLLVIVPAQIFHIVAMYSQSVYIAIVLWDTAFWILFLMLAKRTARYISTPFAMVVIYFPLMTLFSLAPFGSYGFDVGLAAPYLYPIAWIFGSYGIATFMLLVCGQIGTNPRKMSIFFAIIFVVVCAFTSQMEILPSDSDLRIAIVQGTILKTDSQSQLEHYAYLSENISADIIVWPESAIPSHFWKGNLSQTVSKITKKKILIAGTLLRKPTAVYNMAILYADGQLRDSYLARKPFPYLFALSPMENENLFEIPKTQAGIITCFEETDSELVRSTIDKNTGVLISLASNWHFEKTRLLQLYATYSQMRAVENGRYLVRATSTGISQIVNPQGIIIAQLPIGVPATETFTIPVITWVTPYTRFGRWPFWFCWAIMSISACYPDGTSCLRRGFDPRKKRLLAHQKESRQKR